MFEITDYLFNQENYSFWNMTAGSRSIFTLPKISENAGLKRLKSVFKLSNNTNVISMKDHWYLFKQMAQHQNFTQPWQSQIFAFTKDWFALAKKDKAWKDFQFYLFKQSWIQTKQSRERSYLIFNWQNLLKEITQRRIQPTPYLIDTLKHLMLIASEEAITFQPSTDVELAPVLGIQKALSEIYILKKYFSTIMCADLREVNSKNPAYYSLSLPTLIEGSPETKCNSATLMADIKNIKLLIDTILNKDEMAKIILRNKNFEYFHVEPDKQIEILSSKLIPKKDKRFMTNNCLTSEFCATSSFWRGCIMINDPIEKK